MRNLSIKILGEFSDSFIYSGVLFLVDFEGGITIINWEELIKHRLLSESEDVKRIYSNIFLGNPTCRQILAPCKSELEIEDINKFIISKIDLSAWPTDINILSNKLFFSSECGLKYIGFNGYKRFYNEAYSIKEHILFDDCKIFGFDMDNRRTILCGGTEGGIYSFLSNKRLQVLGDDKTSDWIDCNWYENDEDVCLSLSSKNEYILQSFKEVSLIKERLNKLSKKIGKKDSLRFKNNHLLKIKALREKVDKCVENDFIEHYKKIDCRRSNEYIKTRRSTLGVFKEIGNKIVIEDDYGNTSQLLADDEIVNWRIFPKATTHLNQLHLIDNEFINIFGFEI